MGGIERVILDDHRGLKAALAEGLPGSSWQHVLAWDALRSTASGYKSRDLDH